MPQTIPFKAQGSYKMHLSRKTILIFDEQDFQYNSLYAKFIDIKI